MTVPNAFTLSDVTCMGIRLLTFSTAGMSSLIKWSRTVVLGRAPIGVTHVSLTLAVARGRARTRSHCCGIPDGYRWISASGPPAYTLCGSGTVLNNISGAGLLSLSSRRTLASLQSGSSLEDLGMSLGIRIS